MTKVTFASDWVDPGGKTHKADTTADIDPGIARELIYRGKARVPDADLAEPTSAVPAATEVSDIPTNSTPTLKASVSKKEATRG